MQLSHAGRVARLLIVVTLAALAVPAGAEAHHTAVPVVASDYRNRIEAPSRALDGVRASLDDAGRRLRLTVDPTRQVVVLGYVGEPFLRFSRSGVAVNARSATAQGLRLAPSGRIADRADHAVWTRSTKGHSFAWNDARVWASSAALHGRSSVAWTVPLEVEGRQTQVSGQMTREPQPVLWPWIVLVIAPVLAAGVAIRRRRWAWPAALGMAVAAAISTVVALTGFALAGFDISADRWLLFAAEVALVACGLALLVPRRPRMLALTGLAAFAVLQALSELSVFRHSVVVSELPAPAVRLVGSLALGCGLGVGALIFFALAQPTGRKAQASSRTAPHRVEPLRRKQT